MVTTPLDCVFTTCQSASVSTMRNFDGEVLAQNYMFPWIADSIATLAGLNKQMHEVYRDNVRAELHKMQEERETQYLIDMWSGDEWGRGLGCRENVANGVEAGTIPAGEDA